MTQVLSFAVTRRRLQQLVHDLGISRKYQESTQVVLESAQINIRRLTLLALIAIPVHIAVILQFLLSDHDVSLTDTYWRLGIITAHAVLLLMMAALYVLSRLQRRANANLTVSRTLPCVMMFGIMAGGISITTVDQLVTTNITPYLVCCLLIGMVFLTRPFTALMYYASGYIAFFFLIAMHETNSAILLSNRVNGLVAAAMGFMISSMMWRYNLINYRQSRRIIEQQHLLEQKNKELEKMAFYDSLTTLPNRRYFDEMVSKEIALVQRGTRQSCLVMLDIDGFKNVNDTYGHPTGDIILKQVSLLLQSYLRESDLLARLGGEEFIILLPDTSLAGARIVAEKLRVVIEHMSYLIGSQAIHVTASFGVATLTAACDRQINYFSECDKALYKAKENGRNRVETAVSA